MRHIINGYICYALSFFHYGTFDTYTIDPSILIDPCEDKECGQSCIGFGFCDSDGLCSPASENLGCDNGTFPATGKFKNVSLISLCKYLFFSMH